MSMCARRQHVDKLTQALQVTSFSLSLSLLPAAESKVADCLLLLLLPETRACQREC